MQAWVVPTLVDQRFSCVPTSHRACNPNPRKDFFLHPFQLASLVQFHSKIATSLSETLEEIKHLEIVNGSAATKQEKHCYLLKKGGVHTHRKKQLESSIIHRLLHQEDPGRAISTSFLSFLFRRLQGRSMYYIWLKSAHRLESAHLPPRAGASSTSAQLT